MMKTCYGKLAALTLVLILGILLFAPMRNGSEDRLRAYPRNLRMNRGDAYDITYQLDADAPQSVSFASGDETVALVSAEGRVMAIAPGRTRVYVAAEGGARASVEVEVAGDIAPDTATLTLNTNSIDIDKGQVTGLRAIFSEDAESTLVQWRSEDEQVASVDAIGRVRALSGGVTRVVATTPTGLSAAAEVRVHVPGTAVHITPSELTVGRSASFALNTYYLPEDATDRIARWTSSDPSVVSVGGDGVMKALKEGTSVLSVFTEGGLTSSLVVRVEKAASDFYISPTAVTIERGNTLRLTPRFTDADGREDESASAHYISWTSSDPEVAVVNGGEVVGLKSGTARVTASADGTTSSCLLRVEVLVHEVALDRDEVYLLREDARTPIQLTATVSPADADDQSLTWSTSNDLVATVSRDGLVTMTGGYGTAVITARASSSAVATFTVNLVTQLPETVPES